MEVEGIRVLHLSVSSRKSGTIFHPRTHVAAVVGDFEFLNLPSRGKIKGFSPNHAIFSTIYMFFH